MKNYIVIPTYKEVDNLRELLPILTRYNVIIVDDNSLDGTEKLCKKYKNVKLIVRKGKRGLASAVIDGVLSIKERDAKVVVMDADFQHDPKKLPDFFNALDKNGFVCGARNRLNMPFYRKIISKTAKGLAKILVPETNAVSDPMSGYFGFRLNAVNLDKVKPIGYKIMLEFIVNLKPNESIKEVKYDFRERKFGSSKLGFKVIIDYIKQVLRLNNYRVLIFALVGLSGVLVNEGIAFLLHPYLPLYLVFLVSAESSVLTNFMLNHNFTFHRRVKFTKALPRYNLIALAGLLINVGVALYLSMFIEYLLANFFGILIAFIFNYSLSETVAWSNITNYHEKN